MISLSQKNEDLLAKKAKIPTQTYLDKDGLICVKYFGDQTGVSVAKLEKELIKLVAQKKSKGKPAWISIDTSELEGVNLEARKVWLNLLQTLDYDKMAVIGQNSKTAGLAKLLITASGRGFKIRMFDKRVDAKKWLIHK